MELLWLGSSGVFSIQVAWGASIKKNCFEGLQGIGCLAMENGCFSYSHIAVEVVDMVRLGGLCDK